MIARPFVIRLFVLCALLGLAAAVGVAQDETESVLDRYPQALGVFWGEIAGRGLTYEGWMGDVGFHITGGGIYLPEGGFRILDYTVGLEMMYRVTAQDLTTFLSGQLYIFAGAMHGGYIEEVLVSPGSEDEMPVYGYGPFTPYAGVGGGIGIEQVWFEHFSFPVQVGYGGWIDFPTLAPRVNIVVEGGFRYRF
jgi:hypothetical protein